MSLGVSPSSSSPLTTHTRPLPPSRKRNSFTPSPRGTPRITPDSSLAEQSDGPLTSPSKKDQDGTLGGLRERSEEELARAGRGELEDALRKEWEEREDLLSRLEQIQRERKELEEKHDELVRGITTLQAKNDEAFNEQSRMEADLEERDELLDRLRKRLSEAERQARESQKRYVEQEQTFDIERQALQAQETHLQQRIKSLSTSKSSRSTTPIPEVENIASLKDELASINLSHSTLLAKLNTLTKELHDLKILNEELQEENEGWEFLIRERTLNGKLMEKGGILANHLEPPSGEVEKGDDVDVDSELEEEMSELNSDLENQSPIFDDDHHFFATNLDSGANKDFLAPPTKHSRRGGRKNRTTSRSSGMEGNSGLDLASELSMVDDGKSDAGQSAVSGDGGHDEMSALRAEVKQLKESNKALTLYCSKIIDRIITQEGFEHVLSVDYKTRRATSKSASATSRPALKDVNGGSWGIPSSSSPIQEEPPKILEPEPVKEKKARPLSMMVRAMTGPATEKVGPPPSSQSVNPPTTDESKTEKRARRGFSLDFRSLGFGTSSYTSPTAAESSKSSLRPLTLSSKSSSTSGNRSTSNTARKLDIHEEDEEDLRERHRMEATLKLMGINKSGSPGSIPEEQEEEFPINRATWKGGSGRSSVSSGQSHRSGNTPLGRLSSVIGIGTEDDLSVPLETIENPDQAVEVLRAFDERQNERLKEMSKGHRKSMYTSPPKIHSRRISVEEKDDTGVRDRTISKSESVKTLWSLGGGGGSRPNSGEVVVEKK